MLSSGVYKKSLVNNLLHNDVLVEIYMKIVEQLRSVAGKEESEKVVILNNVQGVVSSLFYSVEERDEENVVAEAFRDFYIQSYKKIELFIANQKSSSLEDIILHFEQLVGVLKT